MIDVCDVIVPVWITDEETLALTEAAVASLVPHKRLIVIDNASTLGGGRLREMADVYIRNKENLGYAKAVNQGLKLAGKIAAVANNDIRVSSNWWKTSQEILKDFLVGTIHFRMIPYDSPFNLGFETHKIGRERWCSGSFFVMRNEWAFDENFLNSYDDWDLQTEIRKDGSFTVYSNKAEYQHRDSHTQLKIVDETRVERDKKNREYFKSKHREYPEDMYWRLFPEQMSQPWKPMS